MSEVSYRHYRKLEQKLGRTEANAFWVETQKTFGCDYCDASPGDPCTTAAGLHVPYVHKDRRAAAQATVDAAIWEMTNADVEEDEERLAADRADAVRLQPRVKLFPTSTDFDEVRSELRVLRHAVVRLVDQIERLSMVRFDAEPPAKPPAERRDED